MALEWLGARFRNGLGDGVASTLRNGSRAMGLNWIENLLGAVYLVVIARALGAEVYGLWAYGSASAVLVLGLASFGLDILIAMRLGERRGGEIAYLGETLALAVWLLTAGAAGLALYATTVETDPAATLILVLFIPALIGRGLALWARHCFIGFERFGDYMRVAAAWRVAEVFAGVLWLWLGGGIVGVAAIHAVSWICEAALGISRVRRAAGPVRGAIGLAAAARLMREAAALGAAEALFALLLSAPVVLIRHATDDITAAGQVALAFGAAMIAVSSARAFLAGAVPVLSRRALGGEAGRRLYPPLVLVAALGLFALAAAVAAGVGVPIALAVFGEDFAMTGSLLAPALLIGGVMIAPTGYHQTLAIAGRRLPILLANLSATGALGIALPVLTRWHGIDGAIAAIGLAWGLRATILVAAGLAARPVPPAADTA